MSRYSNLNREDSFSDLQNSDGQFQNHYLNEYTKFNEHQLRKFCVRL